MVFNVRGEEPTTMEKIKEVLVENDGIKVVEFHSTNVPLSQITDAAMRHFPDKEAKELVVWTAARTALHGRVYERHLFLG